jgi:hypothetical protein
VPGGTIDITKKLRLPNSYKVKLTGAHSNFFISLTSTTAALDPTIPLDQSLISAGARTPRTCALARPPSHNVFGHHTERAETPPCSQPRARAVDARAAALRDGDVGIALVAARPPRARQFTFFPPQRPTSVTKLVCARVDAGVCTGPGCPNLSERRSHPQLSSGGHQQRSRDRVWELRRLSMRKPAA